MSAGIVLERVQFALAQACQIPADVHMIVVVCSLLVGLVALLAWGRSAGQRRALARKMGAMQQDLSALQSKYDAEIRWRLAGEVTLVERHQPVVIIETPPLRQSSTANRSGISEETMISLPQVAMPGANP